MAGCAAGSAGSVNRPDRSVITRAEIEASNQTNAYDLVRAVRPHWVRPRGVTSVRQEPMIPVYMDGLRLGDQPQALAEVSILDIEEIRYYDGGQAQFKFGLGNVQGAIEIILRR
jgi:hypothetical protein